MQTVAKYRVLLVLVQVPILRNSQSPKLWRANRPLRKRNFWVAIEPVGKLVVHTPVLAAMAHSEERLLCHVPPHFSNKRFRCWRWRKCLARLLVRQPTLLGRGWRIPCAGRGQRRVADRHADATAADERIWVQRYRVQAVLVGQFVHFEAKKLHNSKSETGWSR